MRTTRNPMGLGDPLVRATHVHPHWMLRLTHIIEVEIAKDVIRAKKRPRYGSSIDGLRAEYFEGDQNVVTGLLSALMQARESMMSEDSDDDGVSSIPSQPLRTRGSRSQPQQKPAPVDNIALFYAFARENSYTQQGQHPVRKDACDVFRLLEYYTEAVMRVGTHGWNASASRVWAQL
eukprot:gene13313-19156_t